MSIYHGMAVVSLQIIPDFDLASIPRTLRFDIGSSVLFQVSITPWLFPFI